jgi:PAS domain-containing protein
VITQHRKPNLPGNRDLPETNTPPFKRLLETLPDPATITADFRMAYVNNAMLELYGYKRKADLTGKHVGEFVHPDDMDSVMVVCSVAPMARTSEALMNSECHGRMTPTASFRSASRLFSTKVNAHPW